MESKIRSKFSSFKNHFQKKDALNTAKKISSSLTRLVNQTKERITSKAKDKIIEKSVIPEHVYSKSAKKLPVSPYKLKSLKKNLRIIDQSSVTINARNDISVSECVDCQKQFSNKSKLSQHKVVCLQRSTQEESEINPDDFIVEYIDHNSQSGKSTADSVQLKKMNCSSWLPCSTLSTSMEKMMPSNVLLEFDDFEVLECVNESAFCFQLLDMNANKIFPPIPFENMQEVIFSIDEYLDHPMEISSACDCCFCIRHDVDKHLCIKNSGQDFRKCYRHLPNIKSYRKSDFCNSCRLSLADKYKYTKRNQFQCEHCKKQFLTRSQLSNHLVTHLKIRGFKCEICTKRFRQSSELIKHERKHLYENN